MQKKVFLLHLLLHDFGKKSFQIYSKECKETVFDEWFRIFAPKGEHLLQESYGMLHIMLKH